MKYVFDIDGTICTQEEDYAAARPILSRIKKVNELYAEGNEVWLFTARGTDTGIDWRETTVQQLEKWQVQYDKLLFGKPSADFYVDDKAVNANQPIW